MKRTLCSVVISLLFILLSTKLYAQPGTLDVSFGAGGIVNTNIGAGNDRGFSIVQQVDGKLLVAGFSNNGTNNDFALIRYLTDGSLDPAFGTGGIVTTPIGTGNEGGQCVIIQPNNKIIVAGFANMGTTDFALVRYNPDGTLDNTFGTAGIVTTPLGLSNEQSQSVVLQTDGKIVAAGFTDNGADTDFGVVRYDTSGVLDPTFNTTGIVTTDFGNGNDVGRSVAVQTDGKIVVGGWASDGAFMDFAVARYNTNGTLDATFDVDGMVTDTVGSIDDQGYSLAIQPDGKLVLAGISNNGVDFDFAIIRFNTDGSLDNSFDTDGRVTTNFAGANDFGYSVAIQADGKILVGGQSLNGANNDFGLARYNPNGSLDLSFGTGGLVTTDLGSTGDIGWSVAIQGDEKVVVAGSNSLSGGAFGVVRYNTCEIIDTSILVMGPSFMANAAGYNYQWVYCDSAFAPIAGQTGQVFTPMSNGNFAVIISLDNCSDTSGCLSVTTFGIENNFDHDISVYPNPTSGEIMLSVNKALSNATVRIVSLTGQTVLKKENLNGSQIMFDISSYPSGIYYMEVSEGSHIARTKVIKK
jgi:uncharacterized delta-60 repeat protein